jgi:hypothetical protein
MRLQQLQCPGPLNGSIDAGALKLPAHAVIYAHIES